MANVVPTHEDVQALYDFVIERADEEHAATMDDGTMAPAAMERFWRVSNSNKLALTATAECLATFLHSGDNDQAAHAWHLLTAAGEEWREHPDHHPDWENVQRAQVRQLIAGG